MKRDLAAQLRALHGTLRDKLRREWDRSLPLEDELFSRADRAGFLGFGEGSTVYQQSYIYGDVRVGKRTWIGPLTVLDGTGGLRIGSHCSISAGVQIYTHDTVKWALSLGKEKYEHAPVTIGDGCHIGAAAVIVRGVRIGDQCVVGAHSFVNRDVPSRTVVAGVPARPIGRVQATRQGVRIIRTPRKRHRE